jgi:DNA-binding NarL/FixJ family response regulator
MRHLHTNRRDRKETVRVLVVDDHVLFAEALMLTLGIDERIEVVGSASSGV